MSHNCYNAVQNSLVFLFIGLLSLAAPAAGFAADDDGAHSERLSERATAESIEDDEVDEPPPDPFGAWTLAIEDDEVDEPPPDPLVGPGWFHKLLEGLIRLFS